MMQHREHREEEHKDVRPLSPILQFLFVPCHRSSWFPGAKPLAVNPPRASTEFLTESITAQMTDKMVLLPVGVPFIRGFPPSNDSVNRLNPWATRRMSPRFKKFVSNYFYESRIA